MTLDMTNASVTELRKRYTNLYIPSDFCGAHFPWQESHPLHRPFPLDRPPCSFKVHSPEGATDYQDPADADYSYVAKVLLLSSPTIEEMSRRSKEDSHPARLIQFLVGLKSKDETVALGGPWSPSLDGPRATPRALVRTAVRTVKASTGLDLSACTQWCRFAEIVYRRDSSSKGGACIETVVLFLPDVWSCCSAEDSNNKKMEKEGEKEKMDVSDGDSDGQSKTAKGCEELSVHPVKFVRGSRFDCALMSLSLLLDYRQEDNKEHSFEVSLFAEVFNEMLMRDFGFRIYRALTQAPEEDKEKKRKGDSKRKDDSDQDDDSDDDDYDDKDGRGRVLRRPSGRDAQLLLSFRYFDQGNCGYLLEKDVDELMHALGLMLSRTQIRKVLSKVCRGGDSLRYRSLVARTPANQNDSPDIEELAKGNKQQVWWRESEEECGGGVVPFRGALVDVARLMAHADRCERDKLQAQRDAKDTKNNLDQVSEVSSSRERQILDLSVEVEESKRRCRQAEDEARRAKTDVERVNRTLANVKECLQATVMQVEACMLKDKSKRRRQPDSEDEGKANKRKNDAKDVDKKKVDADSKKSHPETKKIDSETKKIGTDTKKSDTEAKESDTEREKSDADTKKTNDADNKRTGVAEKTTASVQLKDVNTQKNVESMRVETTENVERMEVEYRGDDTKMIKVVESDEQKSDNHMNAEAESILNCKVDGQLEDIEMKNEKLIENVESTREKDAEDETKTIKEDNIEDQKNEQREAENEALVGSIKEADLGIIDEDTDTNYAKPDTTVDMEHDVRNDVCKDQSVESSDGRHVAQSSDCFSSIQNREGEKMECDEIGDNDESNDVGKKEDLSPDGDSGECSEKKDSSSKRNQSHDDIFTTCVVQTFTDVEKEDTNIEKGDTDAYKRDTDTEKEVTNIEKEETYIGEENTAVEKANTDSAECPPDSSQPESTRHLSPEEECLRSSGVEMTHPDDPVDSDATDEGTYEVEGASCC